MQNKNISEFHNIQVSMEFSDDGFPQVKATHNKIVGVFSIDSGELVDVLKGTMDDFPFKEERLVRAWILIHKDELLKNWQALAKDKNASLSRIAPLQ